MMSTADSPPSTLPSSSSKLEDVLKGRGAFKLDIMREAEAPRPETVASNLGTASLMLRAQARLQVPLVFVAA